MRTIKFRAWDKKNNIMYSNVSFDADDCCPAQVRSPDIDPLVFIRRDNCIIEQFTGLFDKNGKEIYESDEIKFIFEREERIEIVYYTNRDGFVLGLCMQLFQTQDGRYKTDIEIIGNIHEK